LLECAWAEVIQIVDLVALEQRQQQVTNDRSLRGRTG
jgi:hypothetical protein